MQEKVFCLNFGQAIFNLAKFIHSQTVPFYWAENVDLDRFGFNSTIIQQITVLE